MATLTLEIEFANDEEALRTYAHLIGVRLQELHLSGPNFSGTAIPNLFTLYRPAYVTVKTKEA